MIVNYFISICQESDRVPAENSETFPTSFRDISAIFLEITLFLYDKYSTCTCICANSEVLQYEVGFFQENHGTIVYFFTRELYDVICVYG